MDEFARFAAVQMSNPVDDSHMRPATIFFLDLDGTAEALRVAKEIADKTGRSVVVRDSHFVALETVEPVKH
jgi:hypothetical protein